MTIHGYEIIFLEKKESIFFFLRIKAISYEGE